MCTALSDRLWKQQSHVAGKGEPALGEHPPAQPGRGRRDGSQRHTFEAPKMCYCGFFSFQ